MLPGPSHPTDALGLLMACHERIHRYLGGLGALAALEGSADPRVVPTAVSCLRYFRDGLPLHGQDEDHSLAPRLRALSPDAQVLEAMDRMSEEHAALDQGLPEVLERLADVAEGRAAPLVEPHRWLSELLTRHLAMEEATIFPAMSALPPAELDAIVAEIRGRRTA